MVRKVLKTLHTWRNAMSKSKKRCSIAPVLKKLIIKTMIKHCRNASIAIKKTDICRSGSITTGISYIFGVIRNGHNELEKIQWFS
jgi:hypothetical protein